MNDRFRCMHYAMSALLLFLTAVKYRAGSHRAQEAADTRVIERSSTNSRG